MRIRFSSAGGGVQITQADGKIIYSEALSDFLRDYGAPLSLTLVNGVSGFEYDDGRAPPGILGLADRAPSIAYYGLKGEQLGNPVLGPWKQGDAIIAVVVDLLAARNVRYGVTVGQTTAAVAALDAVLKM